MQLREFTSKTGKDAARIVRISARNLRSSGPCRTIRMDSFQIAIDEPTVRNGAILRIRALAKVRDTLDALAKDLQHLVDQSR